MCLINILLAGQFMGDIALPDITYTKRTKEEERLQEEVEKYKQEVLEGLQIEEEGLTDFIRKKTKQQSQHLTSRSYNDPIDNFSGFLSSHKNGQVLKPSYTSVNPISPGNKTKVTSGQSAETATEKTKVRHRKRHAEFRVKNRRRKHR